MNVELHTEIKTAVWALKDVYTRWDLITDHLGFGRFLYHWNQCQK